MSATPTTIVSEVKDDGIAIVTLSKSRRMNAWGPDIEFDFFEAMNALDKDENVRAVVVTGTSKFFCAGADAMFTYDGGVQGLDVSAERQEMRKTWRINRYHDLRLMRIPVIAALNGATCGIGLSLALGCDIRVAANDAKIGVIFPTKALVAEDLCGYIMPLYMGIGNSLYLLFTGEVYPAETEDILPGLVEEVFPFKELSAKSVNFAKDIVKSFGDKKEKFFTMPDKSWDLAKDIVDRLAAPGYGDKDRYNIKMMRRTVSSKSTTARPLLSKHDAGVAIITLNKTVWDHQLEFEFFEALNSCDVDLAVRAIIVTGVANGFCAGANDNGALAITPARLEKTKQWRIKRFHDMRYMRMPVIACINGACCGIGLSLATACDLRFAANDARIGVFYPQRGRTTEDVASFLQPHVFGSENWSGHYLRRLTSGGVFTAEEFKGGFIQKTFESADLLAKTQEYARKVAVFSSPSAVAVIKRQSYMSSSKTMVEAQQIADTLQWHNLNENNPDRVEGMKNFGKKEEPQFLNWDNTLPFTKRCYELLPTHLETGNGPDWQTDEETWGESGAQAVGGDWLNPTPIEEVADGIWEATWFDPDLHDETYNFLAKGCKGYWLDKLNECCVQYESGKMPPCSYVERMIVFELPKGGGVAIYSAIPITDEFKAFCEEKGGVKVIIIPTSEHARYHWGWMDAFPAAIVICPGGDSMETVMNEFENKKKKAPAVIDALTPNKWDKGAIKALFGTGCEVLNVAGFQEILILHRKSRSFLSCDCFYIGTVDKNDRSGWKNFPADDWKELYFRAYCESSFCHLPIYRTVLMPEQKKLVAGCLKKIIAWKPQRIMGARLGKTSDGGEAEAIEILRAHWGWVEK